MTTIALIPARGGSKGVPGKNLRSLCGRPLIEWSIGHAQNCETIDRIVVTTDDSAIAEKAIGAGAEVPFLRPPALASDTSSTESAMFHAIQELDCDPEDTIVLLQPTSPVRRIGSLASALQLVVDSHADSLVSLVELHPFAWRSQETYSVPTYDPVSRPRRQDLVASERLFIENGSIYISSAGAILASKCRVSGNVIGYPMTKEESIDIDAEIDFAIAAAILENLELTGDH